MCFYLLVITSVSVVYHCWTMWENLNAGEGKSLVFVNTGTLVSELTALILPNLCLKNTLNLNKSTYLRSQTRQISSALTIHYFVHVTKGKKACFVNPNYEWFLKAGYYLYYRDKFIILRTVTTLLPRNAKNDFYLLTRHNIN